MTGQLHQTSQAAPTTATRTVHPLQSLANEAVRALNREDWQEAEALFVRLCRLAPKSVQAHFHLGVVLKRRGAAAKARFVFSRAHQLDPNHTPTLFELGLMLVEQKDYADAAKLFGRLVELDPENAEVRQQLGMLLSEIGEPKKALDHLNWATESPGRAYYRAKVLIELGQLSEAVVDLRKLPRSMAMKLIASQRRGVLFMDERIYQQMLG